MEDPGHVIVEPRGWLCCLPCWWLRRNTSVHSVAMLLIMSLLVASPVLFLISTAPSATRPQDCPLQDTERECTSSNDDVCETRECRGAAGRLEAALSWKVDPCEDFYGFACGGWRTHKTTQDHVIQQIQQLLQEKTRAGVYSKLGDFHRSCLKAKTKTMISETLTLLDDLGGYISTDEPDPPDLSSLLGKLFKLNGDPLFDVYVDRELQNHSRPALFIDLPRRLKYLAGDRPYMDKMFHSGWYVNRGHSDGCRYRQEGSRKVNGKYEESRQLILEKLLESFVPAKSPTEVNESQNIIRFSSLINKSNSRSREYHSIFTGYNVNQLQKLYDFIRWIPLLREALDVNVTSDDVIYIMAPTYMSNVARTLSLFHPRTVHNALLMVYATDTLTELVNGKERSELCARVLINILPDAVSSLYVSQYSQHVLNAFCNKINEVIANIKSTLKARIRTVPWMDDAARTAALRKVSSLRIVWPPQLMMTNATTLLSDVEVDPNNFFQNVIKRNRQLRNFGEHYYKTASLKRWAFPFLGNTFYDATLNSIVIPLAALTQTYFHNNLPQYIPYGMMGMVFSHGILHGFDLVGTEYDETGSKVSWMLPETKLRLQARLECIVKQYSTVIRKEADFTGSAVDVSFEWNITRNENMADISGLHVAYETWHNLQKTHPDPRLTGLNLSPSQLFFLHSGQVLCSDIFSKDDIRFQEDFNVLTSERVNSIMMNSIEFAEAFSCTAGRKMNPSKKCSLF